MAELLEIDGVKFETSTAIAGAFGYTADYVSKLAREGKVLARQVGRTWYVERASLTEFARQTTKQKVARKEQLRVERKLERAVRVTEPHAQPPLPTPHLAFAQAVAVFTILAVGSTTLFVAVDEGVGVTDMGQGAAMVASDVASLTEGISPDSQTAFLGWFTAWWPWSEVAETSAVAKEDSAAVPRVAVDAAGLVLFEEGTDEAVIDGVRKQFSDPVEVSFETNDSGLIEPVFKEQSDEAYRFLLVPVTKSAE